MTTYCRLCDPAPAEAASPAKPPLCGGPLGHQLHRALLNLPVSRANLAKLLNTIPDSVPADPTNTFPLLEILRRLPMNTIISLAEEVGIDPPAITWIMWQHRARIPAATAMGDTCDLVALLLHHHPAPITVASVIAAFALPEAYVRAAITRLYYSPPPGIRLYADGRLLALVPDPVILPIDRPLDDHPATRDDPTHPVPSGNGSERAEQDRALHHDAVLAVYGLLTEPDADIPRHLVHELRQAGILTDDEPPHITADARYSLQWWNTSAPSLTLGHP